jgi:hypothetical protein
MNPGSSIIVSVQCGPIRKMANGGSLAITMADDEGPLMAAGVVIYSSDDS